LLDDGRIQIREAQKLREPTDPDLEHCSSQRDYQKSNLTFMLGYLNGEGEEEEKRVEGLVGGQAEQEHKNVA
jgi:hypothetical protein